MMNEKEFRSIYNDFLESGLTLRDFCANQSMNEGKFFYWQNKLKGLLPPKGDLCRSCSAVINRIHHRNCRQL